MQATLESSRKAAVSGKPTSEDLGGQLAYAQSAQATFEVSCPTCTTSILAGGPGRRGREELQ